jgi:hypothetical protein
MGNISEMDLDANGYAVAEEYRSGRWQDLRDDGGGPQWRKTWARLIKELARRSPGHTHEQYQAALEKGFQESR